MWKIWIEPWSITRRGKKWFGVLHPEPISVNILLYYQSRIYFKFIKFLLSAYDILSITLVAANTEVNKQGPCSYENLSPFPSMSTSLCTNTLHILYVATVRLQSSV